MTRSIFKIRLDNTHRQFFVSDKLQQGGLSILSRFNAALQRRLNLIWILSLSLRNHQKATAMSA